MDKHHRMDHLLALLGAQQDHLTVVLAHQQKLETHHPSRERERALAGVRKSLRLCERQIRTLERAVRNARKQHAAAHVAA